MPNPTQRRNKLLNQNAQTAIEYMLLLGIVVFIVFVGFASYFSRINQASNVYYDVVANGIAGTPPDPNFLSTADR